MTILSRRQVAAGVGSSLILSGCATPRGARQPQVLVNLAELADPSASSDQTLDQVAASRDRAHRVTAPVMINGKGPFEFVVDTGANRTVVATELAAELGLPAAGRAEVHGIAGIEQSAMAMVERLDVGRVDTRRVQAPVLPRDRLGADGLLGVDVLRNRRLAIDFRRNTITIYRANAGTVGLSLGAADSRLARSGRSPDGSDYTVVPARMRFGQLIVVDADLGGVPVVAFLDSGSQNTVGNLQLYRRLKARPELLSPRALIVQLISEELMAALNAEQGEFKPYIAYNPGEPVNQWRELNHSERWSTYRLWRDGQEDEAPLRRCPQTAQALSEAEMADIPGLCPNAMFSALAPHTHIPPHTGETNARVVVHLPLVVPENCRYRVGFEQRQWKVGEALIFDDSIEHEARNDSDELRVVLIFDIWNPALSSGERELVRALAGAAREYQLED